MEDATAPRPRGGERVLRERRGAKLANAHRLHTHLVERRLQPLQLLLRRLARGGRGRLGQPQLAQPPARLLQLLLQLPLLRLLLLRRLRALEERRCAAAAGAAHACCHERFRLGDGRWANNLAELSLCLASCMQLCGQLWAAVRIDLLSTFEVDEHAVAVQLRVCLASRVVGGRRDASHGPDHSELQFELLCCCRRIWSRSLLAFRMHDDHCVGLADSDRVDYFFSSVGNAFLRPFPSGEERSCFLELQAPTTRAFTATPLVRAPL
jgi:hypothetical protein